MYLRFHASCWSRAARESRRRPTSVRSTARSSRGFASSAAVTRACTSTDRSRDRRRTRALNRHVFAWPGPSDASRRTILTRRRDRSSPRGTRTTTRRARAAGPAMCFTVTR